MGQWHNRNHRHRLRCQQLGRQLPVMINVGINGVIANDVVARTDGNYIVASPMWNTMKGR